MKKTNIICIILILSYTLSQPIMSSSTKRHYEEIDDLSYETALKKQKTDYLSVEDLLNKLSTKLFLDRQDYQFIEEKDIKEFDLASVNKNIWHSFILIGNYFKKFNKISFTTLEEIKKTETQDNISPHANFNIGLLYYSGQGVKKSDEKACIWYRKAADQGHAVAQLNLGLMYLDGRGIQQSSIEGIKWYQKSANQGHTDAQFNLGLMYQKGQGVEQNDTKAVEWYQTAANRGHADAQFNCGLMYQKGQGVEQNHTKAVEWYQKSADQGYAVAQNNLGVMYANGQGTDQNYIKALELFKKSAIRNHNSAKKNFKSFFNIKFFVADIKGDDNFKKQFKILINDIELIMSLHKQEKEINNPNAVFEEGLYGINNLFNLYKEIIDFEQNSLEIVHVFDNPEFMITCLQPIHSGLIQELNKDAKQYMSLCMTNELRYLSFGYRNVELANKFISLTNDHNNKWIKATQTLTKVNIKLYQTYLKKAIKAQNAMKEVQDLINHNPSSKNLEKKTVLEGKLKKFNILIDNVEIKIKSFKELAKVPDKIKDLFVETIVYRNQLFLTKNNFLQER